MTVSLKLQIKTVEREIRERRRVYGRLVGGRKMTRGAADLGIAHMEAVLDTLTWLAKHEEAVRGRVQSSGGEDRP